MDYLVRVVREEVPEVKNEEGKTIKAGQPKVVEFEQIKKAIDEDGKEVKIRAGKMQLTAEQIIKRIEVLEVELARWKRMLTEF